MLDGRSQSKWNEVRRGESKEQEGRDGWVLVDIWPGVRTAANTHIHAKDPPVKVARDGRGGEGMEEGRDWGRVLPHSYTQMR